MSASVQRNPGHHPEVIKVYKKEFAGGVAPLPETVQAKIQEFKAAPEASKPNVTAEELNSKLAAAQERAEAQLDARRTAAAGVTAKVEEAASRRAAQTSEAAQQLDERIEKAAEKRQEMLDARVKAAAEHVAAAKLRAQGAQGNACA